MNYKGTKQGLRLKLIREIYNDELTRETLEDMRECFPDDWERIVTEQIKVHKRFRREALLEYWFEKLALVCLAGMIIGTILLVIGSVLG